jgi:hypothetical protein
LDDVLRRRPSSDPASFYMLRAWLVQPLGWLDARPTSLSLHAVSLSNLDNDWFYLSTKLASSSRVFVYVGGVTVVATPDLGNGPYSEECISAFSKSGDFPCAQSPRMHGVCGQTFGLLSLRQWVSVLNEQGSKASLLCGAIMKCAPGVWRRY